MGEWDTLTIRLPAEKKKELIDLVHGMGQANISELARRAIYKEMEKIKAESK